MSSKEGGPMTRQVLATRHRAWRKVNELPDRELMRQPDGRRAALAETPDQQTAGRCRDRADEGDSVALDQVLELLRYSVLPNDLRPAANLDDRRDLANLLVPA
jgi:hypothetical protein